MVACYGCRRADELDPLACDPRQRVVAGISLPPGVAAPGVRDDFCLVAITRSVERLDSFLLHP